MKKYGHTLTQAISVPNFWQIWPFMHSLECPKVFGPFRVQDWVPWIQKYNFLKHKKIPHGLSQTISAKFQTDLNIYAFLRVPPKIFGPFTVQVWVPWAQKSKFSKKKKNAPPGIHAVYKCVKFQIDLTIFAFPRVP